MLLGLLLEVSDHLSALSLSLNYRVLAETVSFFTLRVTHVSSHESRLQASLDFEMCLMSCLRPDFNFKAIQKVKIIS